MKAIPFRLSVLNTIPKAFAAKLLNLEHMLASGYSLQSAQLLSSLAILHLRTLHHEAFSFRLHPGQRPFLKLEQAPQ
jgi:hypothetical protein